MSLASLFSTWTSTLSPPRSLQGEGRSPGVVLSSLAALSSRESESGSQRLLFSPAVESSGRARSHRAVVLTNTSSVVVEVIVQS